MTQSNIEPDLVLLSASELARVLGTSTRTVWRLLAAGRLPHPLRVGTRPRWPADELRAWIKAGMPPAEEWEESRV